jgi:hypothetical protein
MATILSSVMGGYDRPKRPRAQSVDAEWVLVTDDGYTAHPEWLCAVTRERADQPPRRRAKVPKCEPWLYTNDPFVIWIDASIEVLSSDFVAMCLDTCPPGGVAAFKHPARDCIYTELGHSLGMPKYAGEPMAEQCATYAHDEAYPHHAGLWAAGVLVRDRSPQVECMGGMWLDEIQRWSTQDQLSLPVVCRRLGIEITPLPGNLLDNDWIRVHPHPNESR